MPWTACGGGCRSAAPREGLRGLRWACPGTLTACGPVLVKRTDHTSFAPAHLLDALLKVGTLQHSRIAETAPHLIKQIPVLTKSPQLANDMADQVDALHVKQQAGGPPRHGPDTPLRPPHNGPLTHAA